MQKVIDREKLLKLVTLANFLDDLPHSKLFMPAWASKDATETSCGTAGCVAGWAATIFAKEGWYFSDDARVPYYFSHRGYVAFSNFFGISLAEAFWITVDLNSERYIHLEDISQRFAFNLLDLEKLGSSYVIQFALNNSGEITPAMGAARIRKIIATYDPSLLEEKSVGTLIDVLA